MGGGEVMAEREGAKRDIEMNGREEGMSWHNHPPPARPPTLGCGRAGSSASEHPG